MHSTNTGTKTESQTALQKLVRITSTTKNNILDQEKRYNRNAWNSGFSEKFVRIDNTMSSTRNIGLQSKSLSMLEVYKPERQTSINIVH